MTLTAPPTAPERTPLASPAGPTSPKPAREHVHQVDLVRVVTFTAVIGVHALGAFTPATSVAGNGVLALLHYTREAFFALTAFVLFVSYYDRPMRTGHFLRRRFTLVGVPYLVWSTAYTLPTVIASGVGLAAGAETIFGHVLRGDAKYHLYFLLVSLQVYLLTPLLIRGVRRCAGHHGLLLTVSAAAQIGIDWVIRFGPGDGWIGGYRQHAFVIVISYQFWVVLGALAAIHRKALDRFVQQHFRALVLAVLAVLAATEGWYLTTTAGGAVPGAIAGVFQPELMPGFAAMTAGVYLLATAWARRRPRPLARFVTFGSAASFGIYLVHPAILGWVVPRLNAWLPGSPIGIRALLAVVVTATASAAFVALVRRTPFSLALCGREWKRRADA